MSKKEFKKGAFIIPSDEKENEILTDLITAKEALELGFSVSKVDLQKNVLGYGITEAKKDLITGNSKWFVSKEYMNNSYKTL